MRTFLPTCLLPLLTGCWGVCYRPDAGPAVPFASHAVGVVFIANGSGDFGTVSKNLSQVVAETRRFTYAILWLSPRQSAREGRHWSVPGVSWSFCSCAGGMEGGRDNFLGGFRRVRHRPSLVSRPRVAPRFADLPASAQGLVNLDQPGHDLSLRLGQRVLLSHQGLLQLCDPREIDRACLVLGHGDLDRLFGILHAGGLIPGLLLGLQEGHQAVFHVLSGAQDGILIGGHQLLKPGILEANVIQDAPIVEDIPREGRTEAAG